MYITAAIASFAFCFWSIVDQLWSYCLRLHSGAQVNETIPICDIVGFVAKAEQTNMVEICDGS